MRRVLLLLMVSTACLANSQVWHRYGVDYGPFIEAIIEGKSLAEIKSLAVSGVDQKAGQSGWTPICFAAAHGRSEAIEFLLTKGANPKITPGKRKNLIHLAAQAGDGESVALLAKAGVDFNARDNSGRTPFSYTAFPSGRDLPVNGYADAVSALAELGAKTTARERAAAILQSALVAEPLFMLKVYRAMGKPDSAAESAVSTRLRKVHRGIDLLLAQGTDWSFASDGNWRPTVGIIVEHPLLVACQLGDVELLKIGINRIPRWREVKPRLLGEGRNLADYAYVYGNDDLVEFLVKKGVPRPNANLERRQTVQGTIEQIKRLDGDSPPPSL